MKTLDKLISDLSELDVQLWLEGEKLRYQAPKDSLSPELLQELRSRKQEIISFLNCANTVKESPRRPIGTIDRGGNLSLSFAQNRLWFLNQLEPHKANYNIPVAYRLAGPLNTVALEQSLSEIVRRHEILRTHFQAVEGTPHQVIVPHQPCRLEVVDLQSIDESQREAEALRQATAATQHVFDLAHAPLFLVKLLRLAPEEHILLINMHHIVSDGWSFNILFRELTTLYRAFCQEASSPLPDLSIQYADFAHWQRDWLKGAVLKQQLTYWKQHLSGPLPSLPLPTDHPRPPVQTYHGAYQALTIPTDVAQRLKALCQAQGVTLFMGLLAAFKVLLYRYSGQADVMVGTPVAGRNRPEIESLIGFFVNTLPLRTELSGDLSFRNLLERVRVVTLDAYSNQDVPFEKLVEELQPERDQSRSLLFQVLFMLQNADASSLELQGLTATPLKLASQTAKFDLLLSIDDAEGGLSGGFEYNTDLFEAATIDRLIVHFQTLLKDVVAHPDRNLSDLNLLTSDERNRLLNSWNQTRCDYGGDYGRETGIHQVFEKQVMKTPEAVAVVFKDEKITYQALNERANQLAHYLIQLGVTTEQLVGLCVNRSVEMIVGLLGILKAGGAYLPLDPASPPERLKLIIENAEVSILLSQKDLAPSLPATETRVVNLDSDWPAIALTKTENLGRQTAETDLAYVMFTSGSTGTPKGVCVAHKGVNRLVIQPNYVDIDSHDVFLQLASIAFDAATFEIWGALLNGAQLVLYPEPSLSLATLADVLKSQNVSILWLTAGLFHTIINEQPEALAPVKQLLAGGDILSPHHIQEAFSVLPNCRLINGYGPTENTTFTCCYSIPRSIDVNRSIPIGKPITNTQIYILDSALTPVPTGVAGELYVGGEGLAKGYLNRPQLTAEKFIENPFSDRPGSRLYKTGDLVRYRADGNVEFLGRQDHQVKIRGFRIELGEIETLLVQHPQVRTGIVVASEQHQGNKRLVAYLVPESASMPTIGELRQFLKQQLPDYMVPSAFVWLGALPLNANGKVDRRALPEPEADKLAQSPEFVAPQTDVEKKLADIWAEVLMCDRISIYDNFFELGGHSLLAIKLVARIEAAFKQKLPLSTLFQAPSVKALAATFQDKGKSPYSSLVALQTQGKRSPLFFVNSVGHARRMTPYLDSEQPFYGLSIFGTPHKHESRNSKLLIQEIATCFIRDMKQIAPEGPYFLSSFCRDCKLAIEISQQLKAQGDEIALLAFVDFILDEKEKSDIGRHQLNLQRLGVKYVLNKMRNKLIVKNQKKLKRRIKLAQEKGDELSKTASSGKSNEPEFLDEYYSASETYKITKYSGKAVLLVSQEFQLFEHTELKRLITGGLEIHNIQGYHNLLFEEPYVQGLTQYMNDILATAHNQLTESAKQLSLR